MVATVIATVTAVKKDPTTTTDSSTHSVAQVLESDSTVVGCHTTAVHVTIWTTPGCLPPQLAQWALHGCSVEAAASC